MNDKTKYAHRPELPAFKLAGDKLEDKLHDARVNFSDALDTVAGKLADGEYADISDMRRAQIKTAVSNGGKIRELIDASIGQLKEIDGFMTKCLLHFASPPADECTNDPEIVIRKIARHSTVREIYVNGEFHGAIHKRDDHWETLIHSPDGPDYDFPAYSTLQDAANMIRQKYAEAKREKR